MAASPVVRQGRSTFAALVDVQPDIGVEDEKKRRIATSQCAQCSLVDFLRTHAGATTSVLSSLVGFFDHLPLIERARAANDERALRAVCESFGVRRIYAVDEGNALPRPGSSPRAKGWLDLPSIRVVTGSAGEGAGEGAGLQSAHWAMIGPDRQGPAAVTAKIAEVLRAGVTRILVGYHRHAAAMDHWSDFADVPNFDEAWRLCLETAWALGATELVLLMPYPACAMLQWRDNRPLEALRARLDMQLRRAGADSSMMCPENVSGYALFNDTKPVRESIVVARDVFGIRYEDLVMLL